MQRWCYLVTIITTPLPETHTHHHIDNHYSQIYKIDVSLLVVCVQRGDDDCH